MIVSFDPLWRALVFLCTAWFTVLPGCFIAYVIWGNRLNPSDRLGISFAPGLLLDNAYVRSP